MSKYLESVCLWEQNEKYLFSFEGFYVKFAFKKGSPSGKGMLEMRSVCTAMERGTQGNCGVGGSALCCYRPSTDPELEGTSKLRLG